LRYRADIDGIRAIAVSVVILFHFGVPGFAGGFIGVDVFFVLSGYLISSIIFSQLEKNRFDFREFYFRRVRRLMPVYAVVMLCSLLAAYLIMLPIDLIQFGQSLFASTIYASNILFYWEAGYFDTESHLKPLLHTWSLSVEEQFYLVFPFLAFFTAFLGRAKLFILFLLLTLISLIIASVYLRQDASAVFFLYPFRAWEMFMGTVLATGRIPAIKHPLTNNLLGLAGLGLILIPTLIYDENTPFPAESALIPCLGTLILLHTAVAQSSWVNRALATPLPVLIGKLSYSLYLWHWPVFVFYHYTSPEGLDVRDIVLMAGATLALSALSYRFIEDPIRHGNFTLANSKKVVFGSTLAVSLVLMGVGYFLYKSDGFPSRLNEQSVKFASAASDLFGGFENCYNKQNPQFPGVDFCALSDPLNANSYTLFWGDSHGAAYKRVFQHATGAGTPPTLIAWTGGCPPVIGLNKEESVASAQDNEACRARNDKILELIENDERVERPSLELSLYSRKIRLSLG